MKRLISVIAAIVLAAALVAGCSPNTATGNDSSAVGQQESTAEKTGDTVGQQESAEEKTGGAGVKTINGKELTLIGLSVAAMDNEFITNLADTLTEAAAEHGVEVVVAEADQTAATQAKQIENMVAQGVQAIAVVPVDINGILDVLKSAKEQGVVISLCGVVPESKDYYDVVANVEQFDLGESAARAAAAWIDKTFPDAEDESVEVAILALNNSDEAIKRYNGLSEVAKLTSKAKIVETYDSTGQANIPTKAQEYTEMMLISHPNVKVIMAYSDFMGLPADEVIMRTPGIDKAQFGIFACDYSSTGVDAINKSISNESTYRASGAFGVKFGKTMFDTIVGNVQVDDLGVYYEPAFEIDASNVSQYLK